MRQPWGRTVGLRVALVEAFALGVLLAAIPGRRRDAETTHRTAIKAGDTGRWYELGRLLAQQPGREREAEHAYREAIDARVTDAWLGSAICCATKRAASAT